MDTWGHVSVAQFLPREGSTRRPFIHPYSVAFPFHFSQQSLMSDLHEDGAG